MSAPGWYPDPDGSPQVRYFDGRQWTTQTAQLLGQGNHFGPASSGPTNQWLWVTIALVVAVIIGVGSWLLFFRDSNATAIAMGACVLALKDADVMHVLVGSVPDADLEAAAAMAAATKDLQLQ